MTWHLKAGIVDSEQIIDCHIGMVWVPLVLVAMQAPSMRVTLLVASLDV